MLLVRSLTIYRNSGEMRFFLDYFSVAQTKVWPHSHNLVLQRHVIVQPTANCWAPLSLGMEKTRLPMAKKVFVSRVSRPSCKKLCSMPGTPDLAFLHHSIDCLGNTQRDLIRSSWPNELGARVRASCDTWFSSIHTAQGWRCASEKVSSSSVAGAEDTASSWLQPASLFRL